VAGYAFGDSALAARRLGLLAEVFEPTSRAFLTDAGAHLAGPGPSWPSTSAAARAHHPAAGLGPRAAPHPARPPGPPGGRPGRLDRAAPLAPPAARAGMFGQNLAVWRDEAVRSGVAARAELDRLAGGLAAVAAGEIEATIAWELRQLAFQRV
jgi:hypothetical protein